ncbi:MAG: hypothetical protein ABEI80_04095 [Haloplanus sp.]
MSNRDDEELAVLLADLERTLTELRSAVDEDVRRRRRPPTPGEIVRLTESYTLPTLIALLEATVQSLELLRAVLRLVGPRPAEDRLRERLGARDTPDAEKLRDSLGDLRDALTRADLPEGSAAGSILDDARALTAEIDDRLAEETERTGGDGWRRSEGRRRETGHGREGVAIDVEEEGDAEDSADAVDVDAELASIKESMATDENGGGEKRDTEEDDASES